MRIRVHVLGVQTVHDVHACVFVYAGGKTSLVAIYENISIRPIVVHHVCYSVSGVQNTSAVITSE